MATKDHDHDYLSGDTQLIENERKTTLVVILTAVMMVVEITAGYVTGSMALLADGWHMASHAGALSIALIAYKLAKSEKLKSQFSFGTGKMIPLGGYTSAIVLAMVAVLMAVESIVRLFNPVNIQFKEAIFVAVVGLIVNLVSAKILSGHGHSHHHDDHHDDHHSNHKENHSHHDHHHHDHNLRSAYVHVIADAFTSILAIVALTVGLFYGASWLDPVMGVVGSAVILKWAYNLCRDTGWELLDGHAKSININSLRETVEQTGAEVLDLHVWKVAPAATSCALIVRQSVPKGSDFYRHLLEKPYKLTHFTIEERSQ